MTALAELVATSRRVGASRSRLAKVAELAGLLKSLQAGEIGIAAHYLSGTLPQGRIGVGFAQLQSAMPATAPASAQLSIADVDAALTQLQALTGRGAAARRLDLLHALFTRATADERDFLVPLLGGELRQGALGGLMIEATAQAAGLPIAQLRRAAMYAGDLGTLARCALTEGAGGLEKLSLQLFSPVVPMLAQTASDVTEALALLSGEVAFEWKMDGARIQVHKRGTEVRIYTRSLKDVTEAIPEVVESVRSFSLHTLVLDGEAIAIDENGRPHPFQVTMRRFGRKLEVERARATLPVQAYFFDCLFADDRPVVALPAGERQQLLAAAVPAPQLMPRLVTPVATEAQAFYRAALAAGHEGVMAKSMGSAYEAGNRGASWLKIKRAHTLDLVVLAAEWGHGRRTGRLSNLHLGALDATTGTYVMLGKTFKGLTDELLEWQTRELLAREVSRDALTVRVRPELVVETAFSDLQASTRYPGGMALRLARVKRYRTDKEAGQADTLQAVRHLFASQASAPPGQESG
ncbi:MAG: ATP-dependent DNA ligase [Proteobacteria bacterium]|nr:ATP-dependent DNA ligase [Pseudomonadota bacterium]